MRDEEKSERLERVKEKKEKYGKKNLSRNERQEIKDHTNIKLELAEAKENLWRKYRQDEISIFPSTRGKKRRLESEDQEEGKRLEDKNALSVAGKMTITEYFQQRRKEKMENLRN